jgi:hypothetical protein
MARVTSSAWFDERIRPLVRFEELDGEWIALGERLEAADLAEIEATLLRRDGAPARVAMTLLTGWTAGYLAWILALGVLRDGVLVRAGDLRLLRHAEGWLFDARLAEDAVVVVADDHAWAGRSGVAVVADLHEATIAEVARACTPVVNVLADRSGRGRAGLWAQVADSMGDAAHALEQDRGTALRAVEQLLAAPGAPWRRAPRIWLADDDVLVKHRSSCCLWYRRDPALSEDPSAEAEADYCDTCMFRAPDDVEARVVAHELAQRRAAD